MDELGVPTPRSRSRSKTPFVLRSQCDKEHCTDVDHGHAVPAIKVPSVPTVEEEQSTPANVRTSSRTTRKTISAATTTVESSQKVTATVITTTSSSSIGRSQKFLSNSNGNNTISGEHILGDLSGKDINPNELNRMFEESSRMHLRTSTPIQSSATVSATTASSSSGSVRRNIDRNLIATSISDDGNDHVPYREYREAGEYWNKYPKTDYTYSRLSPHRRELAPGVVAMPNMSRRSLEKHHDRVNVMAENAPGRESFIRKRYQATNYKTSAAYYDSQDSQDELDEVHRSYSGSTSISSWRFSQLRIVRWLTTIVTTLWSSCTGVFTSNRSAENLYYTRAQQEQGWFRKVITSITTSFLNVFRYVYLAISTVLFLDTWLLRSNSTVGPNKKRFLLLLLILLPLLILAAWQLHNEAEREAFVQNWPQLALSSLSLFPLSGLKPFASQFGGVFSFIPNSGDTTSATPPFDHSDDSMSEQQYRNLLANLKRYVESYVNERIADAPPAAAAPIVFSAQNVADLTSIIDERLAQADSAAQTATTTVAPPIAEIVRQVLQSEQLTRHIDASIVHSSSATIRDDQRLIDEQRQLILALQQQIAEINSKLAKNADAQQNVDESVRLLQAHQDNLAALFREFQAANEERLSKLLLELNVRLDDLGKSQFVAIDNRIKLVLMDALGYRTLDGAEPDSQALQNWMRSVFVAKEALEERLATLTVDRDQFVREEIDRSAGVLMKDITERIRAETVVLIEQRAARSHANGSGKVVFDDEAIRMIVRDALAVYDADKTGLVDYALESAGGEIVSTRCTETYHTKSAQISIFGIPLWYPTNTPRTAISPTVQPGQCWAFQGFPGFLVLKLNAYIHVTGFTMEHIPRTISPNGNIDSAPKTFTVWGLEHENDHEPLQLGTYEFRENGTNLQYFRVDDADRQRLHNIVELRIESNHGNTNYTCLYRFRVHGTPDS